MLEVFFLVFFLFFKESLESSEFMRSKQNLLIEGFPGFPQSLLLLAQLWGSFHGGQQRHDGPALLIEGHQEGLENLKKASLHQSL